MEVRGVEAADQVLFELIEDEVSLEVGLQQDRGDPLADERAVVRSTDVLTVLVPWHASSPRLSYVIGRA